MHFDFALVLVVLTFVSGVVLLLDRLIWRKQRSEADTEPMLVDYSRAFFPVLLLVLVLRSFVFEPFRIPSSSMMPTLNIGDFIIVSKFSYGLRLPVVNTKIIETGEPQRGDIVVFRFPADPSVDYIKRIVGVPGDTIRYVGHQLYVNDEKVERQSLGAYTTQGAGHEMNGAEKLQSQLDDRVFDILHSARSATPGEQRWTVGEGEYFVLGDNRDRSADSRFWGMVPEENLVGRAVVIWMNWDTQQDGVVDFSRIGTRLNKTIDEV
jgi:signal peptidase I